MVCGKTPKGIPFLEKSKYWSKLVEYYYDNVWENSGVPAELPISNIHDWAKETYKATIYRDRDVIYFDTEVDRVLFVLRWA